MMNKTADGARIERLNLAMSYPVRWSAYTVLRDFIQNFFDSIGPEKFGQEFEYSYDSEGRTLSMRSGKGFALDWLMYIGASSKRKGEIRGLGKFGEGFKIASLCAYRDLHWGIRMASRDWVVRVMEVEDQIDGQTVPVLAYEVTEQVYREEAVLILTGVSEKDYEDAFQGALRDFWWPQNPALGKSIASGDGFAIYVLPEGNTSRHGRLYAGYLARAILDVPAIICNHSYTAERDSRERENFDGAEVTRCILGTIKKMTAANALAFLQMISARWSGGKRRHDMGYDWDKIVMALIERVAEDEEVVTEFLETYATLIIADFPRAGFGNRRGQALLWWRQSDFKKRRIVMHDFSKLGIPELDTLCKAHGGYDLTREPTNLERQRIEILQRAALDIFGAILCYDKSLPPVRITINRSPRIGAARCLAAEGSTIKKAGFTVKYHIREIHLRQELFRPETFPEALTTYLHELLHEYGGDSSEQFRRALSLMAGRMYIAADEIYMYEVAWDNKDAKVATDSEGDENNAGDA